MCQQHRRQCPWFWQQPFWQEQESCQIHTPNTRSRRAAIGQHWQLSPGQQRLPLHGALATVPLSLGSRVAKAELVDVGVRASYADSQAGAGFVTATEEVGQNSNCTTENNKSGLPNTKETFQNTTLRTKLRNHWNGVWRHPEFQQQREQNQKHGIWCHVCFRGRFHLGNASCIPAVLRFVLFSIVH